MNENNIKNHKNSKLPNKNILIDYIKIFTWKIFFNYL